MHGGEGGGGVKRTPVEKDGEDEEELLWCWNRGWVVGWVEQGGVEEEAEATTKEGTNGRLCHRSH